MTTKNYDLLIIGGGVVGLTFACALSKYLRVAIIESGSKSIPQSNSQFDLRVSAINHQSEKIFNELDIWSKLERTSPFHGIKVWDIKGNGVIEFDSFEIGQSHLGSIIENRILQQALLQKIEQSNIDIIYAQPKQITEAANNIVLELENQQALTAKLLVGADGAESWVREQACIELKSWPYQHQALVTTVKTELSHQKIARQVFLSNGVLAFLPLIDPHYCSIVWSTTTENALRLKKLTDVEFNNELTAAFGSRLGKVEKTDRLLSFPLVMRHAKTYIQSRIALIGDAAHTIHPLAGQGLNLGIADAACLAEIVNATVNKHRDYGSLQTLRKYERARRGHNLMMIAVMESFKRGFASDSEWIIGARNLGLQIANKNQFIKNFFMRQAMGI